MARAPKSFWQWCRRIFRWCRIFVLLCVLALAVAVLYLNQVGVPAFLKDRVEAELWNHGLDLHLGRVRLRGLHELVARNIQLGQSGQTNGPQLFIREAELRLERRT